MEWAAGYAPRYGASSATCGGLRGLLAARVSVPIIASGGAGTMEHFAELFTHPGIDAGLAASIFHTKQVDIHDLKRFLRERGVEVRV